VGVCPRAAATSFMEGPIIGKLLLGAFKLNVVLELRNAILM
jgi:hypothetical protein